MKLIKIGDDLYNASAIVKISSKKKFDKNKNPVRVLELLNGKTLYIPENELPKLLEITGNIEPVEFPKVEMPDGVGGF